MSDLTDFPLAGKVALVTGATRGLGKGIAVGLAEAGATIYFTGRSVLPEDTREGVDGCLAETFTAIEEAGGTPIPVPIDHGDDEQVRSLFEQIEAEQNGQLDLLVNNVYGGVGALRRSQGKPFWQADPSLWDACNQVGLRSHYIASLFAAQMMTQRRQGLICTISSWGSLTPIFGVAYGAGKSACDRLAADMAQELKPYNVASLSLWPGIVGTEHIIQLVEQANDESAATAANTEVMGAGAETPANDSQRLFKSELMRDRFNWETPLLTGRVIAAIAADSDLMQRTGKVQIVAEVAKQYGLVDQGGNLPASMRSLRFILPSVLPQVRSAGTLIPDWRIPWWVLLLTALKSPKL